MRLEKYMKHISLRFRWRRSICAAVKEARAGSKLKKTEDPTAVQAVKNLTYLRGVRISPAAGGKSVYIQNPEQWLAVMDETYETYAKESPFVEMAMRKLFDEGISGEVIAGLMPVSKRVFYEKRRRFLLEALLLAAEKGILKIK